MSVPGIQSAVQNVTAGATVASSVLSTLSGFLIATPQTTVGYQPQNTPALLATNIAGAQTKNSSNVLPGYNLAFRALIFNYEGENTSTLESDITDHFVENNLATQDHIALRPVIITTQGFIAELNDTPGFTGQVNAVQSAFAAASNAANKLTLLTGYLPGLSGPSLIAYNEAVFAFNNTTALLNAGIGLASSLSAGGESVINGTTFSSAPNQSKQQIAYQNFYGYWVNRVLFTVQTPWAVFQNMAIQRLQAVQSAETNVITDFEVTFKQIRYASTASSVPGQINPANAVGQTSAQANTAVTQPASTASVPGPAITSIGSPQ